ncbi:MAG: tetratricopeptide repeat protein, partial [Sphingobacteriales bacterium]
RLLGGALLLVLGCTDAGDNPNHAVKPIITKSAGDPDSAATAKSSLAEVLIKRNADSAILLSKEVLDYAIPKNRLPLIGKANNTIGWSYLFKGRYDSCKKYLLLSKAAFEAIPSPADVAREDLNLSEAYTRQSMFGLALETLLDAESAAKKINDEDLLADVNRQMAIIYRELGEKDRAIAYFRTALAGYEKRNNDFKYINAATSLAIAYNAMDRPDSAALLLNRILAMSKKVKQNEYQTGIIQEHLGNTWAKSNNHARAVAFYLAAYSNFKTAGNTADIAYEGINLGGAYVQLKDYTNAQKYYLESLRLMDSLSLTNYRFDLIRSMSEMYADQTDWKKAYAYLKSSVVLGDTMTAQASYTQAKELKEKYESEKKENEITLLKKDNELAQLTLQQERTWKYSAGIVLLLLIITGMLMVNRFRIIQRTKRLLEIEKMRDDIASDLHDDIGSTLSSLNIQSRVLTLQTDSSPAVKQHLERVHSHTLAMMDSISDIVWAINPKYDTLESVMHRMREFSGEILEPQNIHYRFEQGGDFSTHLDPKQRKNLYLVFKEIINNTAKHAKCSEVTIDFNSSAERLTLTVKDNGIGFDVSQGASGNGLGNLRNRAAELRGEISIQSSAAGTITELNIPYRYLGIRKKHNNSTLAS